MSDQNFKIFDRSELYSKGTAISRKKMSTPLKYILLSEFIGKGDSILDYGCGKGNDADLLNAEGYSVKKYDPNWEASMSKQNDEWITDAEIKDMGECFDIIICNYVLNVVQDKDKKHILSNIKYLLKKDGAAYISVRNDSSLKEGFGSRGYQCFASLEKYGCELIKKTSLFKMYKLKKSES